ncbi:50S ribosomal protein L3 [Candidatus Orientia mediorientalis]|uniref:50S ribosomal protein L3 n=1 Tax=Candidatus Orientia mediorientalis TaxID=911112 RepID=UPI0005F84714|nr:50S ribosomal protein L3 [Candidatus Orientia mediorientalis]
MRSGLIAEKLGMGSNFDENGKKVAITYLKVDICQVLWHKLTSSSGYNAVVLGYKDVSPLKVKKPMRSIFSKVKINPKAIIKEFKVEKEQMLKVGDILDASYFRVGQYVDVKGIPIGKGFAGPMKRHGFRGLEATHGVSISHRSHGSTGNRAYPGRTFKNKKMAGRMGGKKFVTIANLRVYSFDLEKRLLAIQGGIPGKKGAIVYITDAVKKLLL